MVATKSLMSDLGSRMPSFNLIDQITQKNIRSDSLLPKKGILIAFICNHCPYVIHIMPRLAELIKKYQAQGITTICINSNDAEKYPDDAPEEMPKFFKKYHLNTSYLYDENQNLAKSFQASCTPDFFLYDHSHELVYRGQFCTSRPNSNLPVTGKDLEKSLQALVNKEEIGHHQIPSMGCNIKWKQGNSPEYFKI